MSKILVTGGSGFVGSQTIIELLKAGHDPYITDSTVKPWIRNLLPEDQIFERDFTFIPEDVEFDAVLHLAAMHNVTDSMTNPGKYYSTNVNNMQKFLENVVARNIKNVVYASSSSVYGNAGLQHFALSETTPTQPISPYSTTKAIGEMMLRDYTTVYGINHISLRYFNVSGADPGCELGYTQTPATHLIPTVCKNINEGNPVIIYGTDYRTLDGTSIRDYTHVSDIAVGNVQALDYLISGGDSHTINLAGGQGYTVGDVVTACSYCVNADPEIIRAERRDGDAHRLVADITKADDILDWRPKYTLMEMINHAWEWEVKNAK